ncbi:putative C-5 cytosine-specific DNA methylase [Rosellinia necatrix]|uniref:DNA (cytosine-5-)-methyltransferase n=1 Tax=Rosellinia necatrix TaxID=77044 RepID=A0A1W2TGC7_ROSNE|nr:putative C-5 cytosine-specific DNA methylase [Rosellinia necatrix]
MASRRLCPLIIIPEEDDGRLSHLERRLHDVRAARNRGQRHIPLIDLTEEKEQQQNILDCESQVAGELDGRNEGWRPNTPFPSRNPSIPGYLQMPLTRYKGIQIKPGTLVEVRQRPEDEGHWEFLHVTDIYADGRSGEILRGIRFTRHRNLRGLLLKMRNEICALYDIDKDDKRPDHIQAAVEIPITEVIKARAFCQTNKPFPAHRFNRIQWKSLEDVERKAILVQRWKYYRVWPTAEARLTKKNYSGSITRLRSSDIKDKHFAVPDEQLRNEFRGGIIRGGSFKGGQARIPTFDLENMTLDRSGAIITLEPGQKYMADDMCCGAGGVSAGLRRAGIQLSLACDSDGAAAATYRRNFPEASLKHMSIFDLAVELKSSNFRPDFLHVSPPCQFFSPAHTRVGKNDEANVAVLDACALMLECQRARVSTGEQTFGLLFGRNEEFFNALVQQYTSLGYSFAWDILRFGEFGAPSTRRRLIWIASCPGEALPPFPKPTHGQGLLAPVTLRDVFANIKSGGSNNDPLHDVKGMLQKANSSPKFPKAPYPDSIQVGTVTTAGSDWAHPSRRRNFTQRELATIQGFPQSHQFLGTTTEINRQIGNAFSPVVVETLYRHLKEWLLQQDRVRVPDPAERSSPSLHDYIIIDGDEENSNNVRQKPTASVEQCIVIDDECDVNMIDLTGNDEEPPGFSRESSRTLSAESLPALLDD